MSDWISEGPVRVSYDGVSLGEVTLVRREVGMAQRAVLASGDILSGSIQVPYAIPHAIAWSWIDAPDSPGWWAWWDSQDASPHVYYFSAVPTSRFEGVARKWLKLVNPHRQDQPQRQVTQRPEPTVQDIF